jgi:hypothetical protein
MKVNQAEYQILKTIFCNLFPKKEGMTAKQFLASEEWREEETKTLNKLRGYGS